MQGQLNRRTAILGTERGRKAIRRGQARGMVDVLIPVTQTVLGSPYGNCMAACMASITGIPLSEFPTTRTDGTNLETQCAFLLTHGVKSMLVSPDDLRDYPNMFSEYAIARGRTSRGHNHACVCRNGRVCFDPHPSRVGLESIYGYVILY